MNDYKIVVLISGNGSTLQAIIDAVAKQQVKAKIAAVISNRADAYGLQRAQLANIPTHVIPHQQFSDRSAYDAVLAEVIDQHQPQLIVLAGFMRILTPAFVQRYTGKLINIHPSLLPDYRGTQTHERVLAAQEKYHGTSVHFVSEELDGGPLIAQAYFPVENAALETLQTQVHKIEHQLYPLVINWMALQKLCLENGKVIWLDHLLAQKTTDNYLRLSTEELYLLNM